MRVCVCGWCAVPYITQDINFGVRMGNRRPYFESDITTWRGAFMYRFGTLRRPDCTGPTLGTKWNSFGGWMSQNHHANLVVGGSLGWVLPVNGVLFYTRTFPKGFRSKGRRTASWCTYKVGSCHQFPTHQVAHAPPSTRNGPTGNRLEKQHADIIMMCYCITIVPPDTTIVTQCIQP